MVPQSFFYAFLFAGLTTALCVAQNPHAGAASHVEMPQHPQVLTQVALVAVTCTASPQSVFSGGVATIRAEGRSLQGLPLHYTFTTNAGELSVSGATSTLNTIGVTGPMTVHVTCTAIDSLGRSASQVAEVNVLRRPLAEEVPVPVAPDEKPMKKEGPPFVNAGAPLPPLAPKPVQGENAAKAGAAEEGGSASAPAAADHGGASQPEPGTATAIPDAYKESEAEAEWFNKLKQGKIEYKVPHQMFLLQSSTVTAVIHGFEDIGSTAISDATGTGLLKQSPQMKVELIAADDPDAFKIELEGDDAVRKVPINGTTTWMWKVTPNKSGTRQRLTVRASVIYADGKTERQLEPKDYPVEVDVPSLWATIVYAYQHDPLKFFSYMIPGGAGFTFMAGLVVWWWKQKHKDEKG